MATTLSVETTPGSNVFTDLTAYLAQGSPTVKFNTVDFLLWDPPAGAVVFASSGPQQAVKLTDPAWVGTIASVMTADPDDLRFSHETWTIAAVNTTVLPSDTAPFDLSDVPADATTVYQMEDGSTMDLESGTDWSDSLLPNANLGQYETEGAKSQGYSKLSIQVRTNAGAAPVTRGLCTVHTKGLRPGNLFNLTSLNQGYVAKQFQITQVTTKWPELSGDPVFSIEFGDTPQTLAIWSQINSPIPPPVVIPPPSVPPAISTQGACSAGYALRAMGGGIVTIASATFTISVPSGHSLTCQVQGAIDVRTYAWDDYVAVPRRGVCALLSGGIFTGAWQETPFGFVRATYDLSSALGIALPAGTYTLSIQIDTQEYNQLEVFSAWASVAVTTV